jgi:hypothetical protein
MPFKRLYNIPDGWVAERDERGELLNPPELRAVCVLNTGPVPEQNFGRQNLDEGINAGWISMGQGKITLHVVDEAENPVDLVYTIMHVPGTYCCHCDLKLDDDPSGASNRAHVAERHGDTASPDPQNPAGYRVTTAYECVLDPEQHAQFNLQTVTAAQQARATQAMSPAPVPTNGTEAL